MAPPHARNSLLSGRSQQKFNGHWRDDATPSAFIVEAWGEGCMFGALMIMACVTIASMRKGVLLHKLILLELLLAIMHGTFCFMSFPGYGWYLSGTACLLYCSWVIHNLVAWMKIKPFFDDPRSALFSANVGWWVSKVYLGTLALTIPPIILQIVSNFLYFNNINDLYTRVRPAEPAFRDPWWIFTCLALFHVIRKCYGTSVIGIIGRSPRLGILLAAICLAMIFTLMDILASAIPRITGSVDGINPYWKLALIFKCLTDNIMLDDFSTELKRIGGATGPLALEPARSYDPAPAEISEKPLESLAEVEHAGEPSRRSKRDGPTGLAERDLFDA